MKQFKQWIIPIILYLDGKKHLNAQFFYGTYKIFGKWTFDYNEPRYLSFGFFWITIETKS